MPARAQLGDSRLDDLDILAAERAAFAGMRVEPGDRETGAAMPKSRTQRRVRDAPGMHDRGRGQALDRLAQRQMDRHRHDAQLRRTASIITGSSAGPGELGEIFGVPGMAETGAIERVLVDRVGDQRRGAARLHIGDGGLDRAGSPASHRPDPGGPARPRIAPPTGRTGSASREDRWRFFGTSIARDTARASRGDGPAPRAARDRRSDKTAGRRRRGRARPERDLAADPGRLAHRHGERKRHRGSNPHIDKGGAPQVAHDSAAPACRAAGASGFRRSPRASADGRALGVDFLADHDDPDAVLLHDRLRRLPGLQRLHDVAHPRGDLVDPQTALARQLRRSLLLADLQQSSQFLAVVFALCASMMAARRTASGACGGNGNTICTRS